MKRNGSFEASYLKVYKYLKDGLIRGVFNEDYAFVETDIAEQLGVSRTPVREAIKMLKSEKLLVSVPKKGIICNPLTINDISPAYELAGAIESMAAYSVASNSRFLDFSELECSLSRMGKALQMNQKEEWAAADADFHQVLLNMADNKFAKEAMDRIRIIIEMIRTRYTIKHLQSMERSTNQHRETFEAIISGDADYTCSLVQHHWKSIRSEILKNIQLEWCDHTKFASYEEFCKYGIMLRDNSPQGNEIYEQYGNFGWRLAEISVTNREISEMSYHDNTAEGFILLEGKVVLKLSLDNDLKECDVFLLDRPVMINACVWHGLAALTDSARVLVIENSYVNIKNNL